MRTGCRKKGWVCLALVLAMCVALIMPQTEILARGRIDTGRKCSLTVSREMYAYEEGKQGKAELIEDLDESWEALNAKEITVNLYKLADINEFGQYTNPKFDDLGLEDLDAGMTAADWNAKAIEAAKLLDLPIKEENEEEEEAVPETPKNPKKADKSGSIQANTHSVTFDELELGMYLVWAEDVMTDEYNYTFLPYLVSLPNNEYDASLGDNSPADEWLYEVTVGLKPERQVRYGDLEIRKTLNTYNASLGEAMFVFQVEATRPDEEGNPKVVYSNVLAVNFAAPGMQTAKAEHIPAGAKVTVTEIYAGASYELSGTPKEQTVTIIAEGETDAPAHADFVNDYNNDSKYGTGVINRFTYENGSWLGTQVGNEQGGAGDEDE